LTLFCSLLDFEGRIICVQVFLPYFQLISVILDFLDVDVDGEMGVDVAHLVFVSFCHANDEILDNALDGAEGSDILARAVVDFDLD
jgi:hypothetical protein